MLPSIASLILALIPAAHGPDSSLNLLSSSTTCLTNRLYGLGIWTLRDRQYVLLSIAWTGKEGTLIHALKTSSPWRVDVSLKQTIGGTFSWYVALSWRPAVRASLCLLHVNSRWKCRCCWWWEMDPQNALKAHWVSQVSGMMAGYNLTNSNATPYDKLDSPLKSRQKRQLPICVLSASDQLMLQCTHIVHTAQLSDKTW